jgi:hypothetical protein
LEFKKESLILSWNSRKNFNVQAYRELNPTIPFEKVFLWFRSQFPFGRGLFFAKVRKDCDFVLIDLDKPVALIQVCWAIDEKATLQRELD